MGADAKNRRIMIFFLGVAVFQEVLPLPETEEEFYDPSADEKCYHGDTLISDMASYMPQVS